MRIAVLVYGRLNKCKEHHFNVVHCIGTNNNIDFFASSDNSPENLLNDFINVYKPISYTNEPIHYDYDITKGYSGEKPLTDFGNFNNMTRHFINKNRVWKLLEDYITKTGIRYDIVLSLRIDVVYQNNFNFDELLDNTIYIPVGNDYLDGINDQIAYGKIDVMQKYNSINVKELIENGLSVPHPETLTLTNIRLHNLQITRVPLSHFIDR